MEFLHKFATAWDSNNNVSCLFRCSNITLCGEGGLDFSRTLKFLPIAIVNEFYFDTFVFWNFYFCNFIMNYFLLFFSQLSL